MRVILLSAGRGRRMGHLTKYTPKCLLKVKGRPVLQHQIEALKKAIKKPFEIILVTGYKSDIVTEFIKKFKVKIKIVYNPFYCVADNFMSLWMAKDEIKGETLIINGDDIFNPDVVECLFKDKSTFCTVISKKKNYDYDDMKIRMNEHYITIIDKGIPDPDGENAGIIKIGKEQSKVLKLVLEEGGKNELYLKLFWLQAINDMIKKGCPLSFWEVDRDDWSEIDVHPDLKNIEKSWKVE